MKASRGSLGILVLFFLAFTASSLASTPRPLTFEERVKAQEAIERVYYNHRLWPKENPGPKPPFEEIVPKAQIEAKVTDYLKKCNALDKFWQRPITGEQLQAEMDRMAKGTKDPATLRELFAALKDDPTLIAECLARPILADRLIHNWYTYDTRFHGEAREKADEAAKELTPENFASSPLGEYSLVRFELRTGDDAATEELADGKGGPRVVRLDKEEWERLTAKVPAEGRVSGVEESEEAFAISHTLVKGEREMALESRRFSKTAFGTWWEAEGSSLSALSPGNGGASLVAPGEQLAEAACPLDWEYSSLSPFLDGRTDHTAVWTGTEMIVWGGNPATNTGGRYIPSTDSWDGTSTGTNCPAARYGHTAVWTGTEMIVWGGDGGSLLKTGGRYSPSSDSWLATPTGGDCPAARYFHTAVWTGTEMIVWGGNPATNTGGRYTPSTYSWVPTSTGTNCPAARYRHTAVWTGTEMIVWGGNSGSLLKTGGRYSPSTNSWVATSTGANCPIARDSHTAVWTGTEMIVWGGERRGLRLHRRPVHALDGQLGRHLHGGELPRRALRSHRRVDGHRDDSVGGVD